MYCEEGVVGDVHPEDSQVCKPAVRRAEHEESNINIDHCGMCVCVCVWGGGGGGGGGGGRGMYRCVCERRGDCS